MALLFASLLQRSAEASTEVIASGNNSWFLDYAESYQVNQGSIVTSDSIYETITLKPFIGADGVSPAVSFLNEGVISRFNDENNPNSMAAFNFIAQGELINKGSIEGWDLSFILTDNDHQIINDGRITAANGTAIVILGGEAVIDNRGVIEGKDTAIHALRAKPVTVVNSGSLTSEYYEAVTLGDNSKLENRGSISSQNAPAIIASGNNNIIELNTGSAMSGAGNTVFFSKGNGNALVLKGDGSESGNFVGSTPESGLAKITVVGNSHWELSGNISAFGAESNVVDIDGLLQLSGNTTIAGDGGATVNKDGVLQLSHNGTLTGNVTNYGTVLTGSQNQAQTGVPDFTINGDVFNAGQIALSPDANSYGHNLVINGNYTGQPGSTLRLNGSLAGDDSLTDHLVINGNANGTTAVEVNNVGGLGAKTLEGIEIIKISGVTAADAFVQKGRIVAGSYDYFLQQAPQSSSWQLSSALQASIPKPEPTPEPAPTPQPGLEPEQDESPPVGKPQSSSAAKATHILRPEAGAYAVNNAVANQMFVTQLQDRVNASVPGSSLWMRQTGEHQNSQAGNQVDNTANQYVVQLGGDVLSVPVSEKGALHVGLIAGYGYNSGDSVSTVTGYRAKRSSQGYSGGTSATWYADESQRAGLYSDNWLLYNHFSNSLQGDSLSAETWTAKGISASTEWGYRARFGLSEQSALFLQPQVQVIWMNVKADDHQEANGSKVTASEGNVATRLGLRTALESQAGNVQLKPYVELNWIHNSSAFGATINETTTTLDGMKDVAELKTGLSANVTQRIEVAVEAKWQKGHNQYQNAGGMLNLRYHF